MKAGTIDPSMGLAHRTSSRARLDISDYLGVSHVVGKIISGTLTRVCLFTSKKRVTWLASEVARRLAMAGGDAVLEVLPDGAWLVRSRTASVMIKSRESHEPLPPPVVPMVAESLDAVQARLSSDSFWTSEEV